MYSANKFLETFVFIVTMFFLISGCGSEETAWKDAERMHTSSAYEKFLEKYPNGIYTEKAYQRIAELTDYYRAYKAYLEKYPQTPFAEKALLRMTEMEETVQAYQKFLQSFPGSSSVKEVQLKLDELYNERRPELKGAKTARYILNTSFPGGLTLNHFIGNTPEILISYAGLEQIQSDQADVTLTINMKAEPISAEYSNLGIQYSGAEIKGSIEVIYHNITILKEDFHKLKEPPIVVGQGFGGRFSSPTSAPFDEVIEDGFTPNLIEIFVDTFGNNILNLWIKNMQEFSPAIKILAAKWKNSDLWATNYVDKYIADASTDTYKKREITVEFIKNIRDSKDNHTISLLIKFMKHIYTGTQDEAISSLGAIGDVQAVKPLMEFLLQIPDNDISRSSRIKTVTEALGRITGEKFGEDQLQWKNWWENNKDKFMKSEVQE
ncbi:hypothetical protein U27_06595 [Candidatus Vecturithrix granuli]|uniref:Lipoprotein n=1 Tax=Vecturithrix granuli TaxID=1499967 RepID=A0A081C4V5_VECG1|nr:hypothetical protein U27_06595 [Candidatus Vecturithrix granuli]